MDLNTVGEEAGSSNNEIGGNFTKIALREDVQGHRAEDATQNLN